MATYVDGFVIPVPAENLAAYRRMSRKAREVWMELGALDYKECVGDDLEVPCGTSFPKGIRAKPGETVVFAFIIYKSKAQRNSINAKVMKDPRIQAMCDETAMPFDAKRMIYGGFKTFVGT